MCGAGTTSVLVLRVYPSDHSDGAASVYTDAKMEGFYAQYNDFYSKSSYGKPRGSCDLIVSHLVLSCVVAREAGL